MTIQPYLFFGGRADEAVAFYQKVFGAEVQMLLRYKESPDPAPEGAVPPGWEDKVMHMSLKIGDSIILGSDGCGAENAGFKSFGLTYAAKDAAEADKIFAALSDGGQVRMPLGKTFFASRFGMVEDRFGLLWMVIVPA
ncbi:VOC family protein [Methylocapsa acidiphila]|uniref:VOC family protein n=1 Tax=Methylocapsa acidiphila TaxID=133552 RepID=UPI000404B573|nr:VOC family protein [Methylocapsa acidiphila]